MDTQQIEHLQQQLDRMEASLTALVQKRAVKDFYSTAEIAALVDKAEFTVREWCRLGRIHAQKRATGRGPVQEWMVAHDELVRYQSHGLLPVSKHPCQ